MTALKKSGDKWQIIKPVEMPAADSDVAVVTSAIGQMEINCVVDEKPADLKEYGLDLRGLKWSSKRRRQDVGKVLVGDKTATPGNLYAKKSDEPRVFPWPTTSKDR